VSLALVARNEARLEEVSSQAMKLGAKEVKIYPTDLSQTDVLSGLAEKITSDFGKIDVLINNAGIWQKMMQLDEIEASRIDPIIATNLSAVVHLTHSILPHLRTRPEAAILNIVSQS